MTTETTTKAPTTKTTTPAVKENGTHEKNNGSKRRPLIFDRPDQYTEPWVDKQLLLCLVFMLGKDGKDRRKVLFDAIKVLNKETTALDWALERSVVEAAVRNGDRKMAALQMVARHCRMPTLRVRSNGEIIDTGVRAVELLTAVVSSPMLGLTTRWREMRALLLEAGFRASTFEEASKLGRSTDGKRHRATITAAVEGQKEQHRRKPRKEERGNDKKK